jgi:hypothetical protein
MKKTACILALLCIPSCPAQEKSAATSRPVASSKLQLKECQANLDKTALENSALAADAARANTLTLRNAELEKQNAELAEKVAHATIMLKVLHKEMAFVTLTDDDRKAISTVPPGSEILESAVAIEKDQNEYIKVVQKLVQDNSAMVQKYNSLLAIAQNQQAQLDVANSRQQRVNNALAFYNVMPKYQPPQTVNVQVTNCTTSPALCVH